MPWVTFTAADIRDGLARREIQIYEETAEKDEDGNVEYDTTERIERIASRLIDQFRGVILANDKVTTLGPEGTIPKFCVGWAIAIARVSMLGLNPVEEGRTDPRRDEYNDALKGRDSLKTMPAAAFAISEPTAPAGEACGAFGGDRLMEF